MVFLDQFKLKFLFFLTIQSCNMFQSNEVHGVFIPKIFKLIWAKICWAVFKD